MASFNRADYRKIFVFAGMEYLAWKGMHKHAKSAKELCLTRMERCTEIMDLCEGVIGQQSDRPDRS